MASTGPIDTHALAVGTGGALVEAGGDTWFFLTADYAFGYALEKDTSDIVKAKGGKVLGSVRIPLNSSDFSSFLLQAQSSKAKIIGLANAGLDTTNSIKQAAEFGIVKGGQKLAGLLMTLAEVHGLGLEAAQGLVLTEGFYWDRDDKIRAFAERFFKRTGRMPSMIQAGTYSATLQYLKAVKAAGTKDSDAVARKLKELPVDDVFAQGARCWKTAAWCTTSICSRSRSRRNRRSRGTITSSSPWCPATRRSPRPRTAAAR